MPPKGIAVGVEIRAGRIQANAYQLDKLAAFCPSIPNSAPSTA
jgi:hypothetical protein